MDDFIGVYDGALSAEQCDAIRARFDASGKVARGRTGNGVDISKKDSYDLTINGLAEWDDVGALLTQTMARYLAQYMDRYRMLLIGALSPQVAHPETGEPVTLSLDNFSEFGTPNIVELMQSIYRVGHVNLQKYVQGSGGYHHWHSEIYPQNASCETLHRVLLWQFYLNDVEDGGETEFLYQSRKVEARKGRLVIAPAGFTHTHKGHVSRSGDKYIATSWILFQRAEAMFG
ncbi:2OG-Fe(II) oxygenase [Massilia sp. G4R7]|uniref:2OG-Fe(II) oxygenase n=1 Tax=Massilia phyllostachyos TaxID=2898585 RepID=A0ABS8QC31_9BURK|nr:2OG-Fe(II) oxygenase [Massilia phyllostachyos]MCD2518180.1 2OG-Fe(II) oxygenase [Massilia phyllostachyos]